MSSLRDVVPELDLGELREMIHREALQWGADEGAAEGIAANISGVLRNTYVEKVESRAMTRRVSEIAGADVRWLWHHRIPRGMLSEVCGDPGEGKSHATLAIATAVTRGVPLPGDPDGFEREPGNVLLVCMEDSPEVTVRPRLESMGADLERVTILDGFRGLNGSDPLPLNLSEADHRTQLHALVVELGATLVVIDPVTAHLGGANEWKDGEVRSILAPLARIADETDAAILLVRHLRKSDSARAIYRAGGSIAFTASVRSSLLVGRPEGEEVQRALVRVKGNLSPDPQAVGFILDETGFGWTEAGEWTPADLLAPDTSGEERTKLDEAVEFLEEELSGDPVPAKEIQQRAKDAGHETRTLRRAADKLGVEKRKPDFRSGWVWSLPQKGTGARLYDDPVPFGAPNPGKPAPDKDVHEGDTAVPLAVPLGAKGTTKRPGDVPLENGKQPQGFSGDADAEGDKIGNIPTRTDASLVPVTSCADCGTPVEENPAFSVQRCTPCAIRAGKEDRDHG